jgi:hypothetical protein
MFGREDLKQLIDCAARALECEDHYLADCANARGWRNTRIGICDNINERYYQFVIWRALMSSFRWRPRTERGSHDLAFYNEETNELVAVAEIKGWWSSRGESEIPGIKRDIEEKLGLLRIPGVMLVLTCQRTKHADDNLLLLAGKVGISRESITVRSFNTSAWPGDDGPREFTVMGFLAAQRATAARISDSE